MLRAVCIYNQHSGRALSCLDDVRLQLRRHDYEVEFERTVHPRHATELARQAAARNVDLVIAAGGDGTVNEVACGLALSTVPLAVLPCGTSNVLARELGLPKRIPDAVCLISRSKPTRIALGKGDSRYFVMMAGVGVDAQIVYGLNAKVKQAFGEAGFWLEALRHWTTRYRLERFSVDVDGTLHQATFAIISRVGWYAGGVKITSRADLRQNQFDVCIFKGTSRLDYLRYLAGVLSGTHPQFHDVAYTRGSIVQMNADRIRVQMDGEIAGTLPMQFQFVPDALTLLIP
jgi:YegS/Rv2252/BmrU family lipid kinase